MSSPGGRARRMRRPSYSWRSPCRSSPPVGTVASTVVSIAGGALVEVVLVCGAAAVHMQHAWSVPASVRGAQRAACMGQHAACTQGGYSVHGAWHAVRTPWAVPNAAPARRGAAARSCTGSSRARSPAQSARAPEAAKAAWPSSLRHRRRRLALPRRPCSSQAPCLTPADRSLRPWC